MFKKNYLKIYILIIFLSFVISFPAKANPLEVVISEIAWMGTLASDDDEWIELYNNTANEINLSGWILSAQDGTPKINLTGKIPAQSFYILERTDDTAITDIVADQIYTGALNNSGEHLILKDSSGNIIDEVDAWYSGDVTKRATMERIDTFKAGTLKENWTLAQNNSTHKDAKGNHIVGSPKALTDVKENSNINKKENLISDENDQAFNIQKNEQNQNQDFIISQNIAANPILELRLQVKNKQNNFVDADEISLFTNDPLTIKALANISLNANDLLWSDGRGQLIKGGFEFETMFQFAGTYIITALTNKNGLSGSAQLKVNVFAKDLIISEFLPNPSGADKNNEWIELYNQNNYAVNLAGYALKIGDKKLVFADPTFIYPESFLVIPLKKTSINLRNKNGDISLVTPSDEIIDSVLYSQPPKENYAAARDLQNKDKFFWTSKPTPGFINLINPTLSVGELTSSKAATVSLKNKNVIIIKNVQIPPSVEDISPTQKTLFENQLKKTIQLVENEENSQNFDLKTNVSSLIDNKHNQNVNKLFTPFNIIIFEIIIFTAFCALGTIIYFKRKI